MKAAAVLASLGLAILVTAFFLYPRTSEVPTPGYPNLTISSAVPVESIDYGVHQDSDTTAQVVVEVQLMSKPTGGVLLEFRLPPGTVFADCPPPACSNDALTGDWTQQLTFNEPVDDQIADANFVVKASHYGLTSDSLTTSVVIPQVTMDPTSFLTPTRTEAMLKADITIPSANSYDWSAFSPIGLGTGLATWQEQIANYGTTPSRIVIGINHAAQSRHDS